MRELESLDLHSKDPFPLPESGRGKANQINILTNSSQMVKFFLSHPHQIVSFPRDIRRLDWTGSESNGASYLHKHRGDEQQ